MSTAATKQRGPYAKTAALRVRILETCIELFGQTGFHNLTMKEVAKQVGISNTGLLHHFASKDELLSGVLQLRDEQSQRFFQDRGIRVLTVPESAEEIKAMLKIVVANEVQPGLIELHSTLAAEASAPDHPAHDYYQNRYDEVVKFYAEAFRALSIQGELTTEMAPVDLAAMFVALTDGLQLQWLYKRDTARLESRIREFLRTFIKDIA